MEYKNSMEKYTFARQMYNVQLSPGNAETKMYNVQLSLSNAETKMYNA
jgi:hypothetical protein